MSLKHMKSLIVLVVGLLAVGCLTPEQKQKRLRDSVVGEYERKDEEGDTWKLVFLDNGVWELYRYGKKEEEDKWSIVKGEIHAKSDSGYIEVWRINKDKSITQIVYIVDGKRKDIPKEIQRTWKKTK